MTTEKYCALSSDLMMMADTLIAADWAKDCRNVTDADANEMAAAQRHVALALFHLGAITPEDLAARGITFGHPSRPIHP